MKQVLAQQLQLQGVPFPGWQSLGWRKNFRLVLTQTLRNKARALVLFVYIHLVSNPKYKYTTPTCRFISAMAEATWDRTAIITCSEETRVSPSMQGEGSSLEGDAPLPACS
jgi:hypothetical protein